MSNAIAARPGGAVGTMLHPESATGQELAGAEGGGTPAEAG